MILHLLLVFSSFSVFAKKDIGKNDAMLTFKNFYIVSAIEDNNSVKLYFPNLNAKLENIGDARFNGEEILNLKKSLLKAYDNNQNDIDKLLNQKIKPSGNYTLFHSLSNKELWLKCWDRYFITVNYCIDVYGLGKKIRYPAIDSASYDVKSEKYQGMLQSILDKSNCKDDAPFYEAPLKVALALLELNGRDEAIRYEPIGFNQNRTAKNKVRRTDFSIYQYSAIIVPGEGPDKYGIRISDESKKRCRLSVERYNLKKAPFIIVSGGNCHPFRTEFNEAEEMKRFLVDSLKIPASAIIMDPHARHTTTNFRNASRYIIEYGFPLDKPVMLVTTLQQADYIANPKFGDRNMLELGYLPYQNLKRLSSLEFSFLVTRNVLTRDAVDPLDP